MLKIQDAVYAVLDTETTGLSHQYDRVIQLGIVWCDWQGNQLASFESMVDPHRDIPPEASAVNHLTAEDVDGAPDLQDVIALAKAHHPYDVLVAHNADFDFPFVPEFTKNKHMLCTLRLSRKLWPSAKQHKNQYLRYWLKLKVDTGKAHSALPDATVTSRIMAEMFRQMQDGSGEEAIYIEDLEKWQITK